MSGAVIDNQRRRSGKQCLTSTAATSRTSGLKLIVGLGNPGYQYELTPHNLGFRVVDHLAQDCGVEIDRPEAQALTAVARIEGMDVVLAKPQTFMNLSGLAVARELKDTELADTPIIFMTASKQKHLRARAEELNAAGFIEKPFDTEKLLSSIDDKFNRMADLLNARQSSAVHKPFER